MAGLESGLEWEKLTGSKQLAEWVKYVADFAQKYAENMEAYDDEKSLPYPEFTGKRFREIVLSSIDRLRLEDVDPTIIDSVRVKINTLKKQDPKGEGVDVDMIKTVAAELLTLKID